MSIKLKGSSDGSVSFDAPADTSPSGSDITLTLPTSAGSANQFLKNSGTAGTLEYSSMVEDSSGRVGIGETSPGSYDSGARNLVVGSTGQTGILIKAGTSSYSNLYFGDGTGSASYRGFVAYNHNGDSLRFGAAGQERMRIDSSGKAGIGVSSPAATLHLSDSNHGIAAGYVGGTLPDVAGIYTSSSTSHGQAYGSLIVQARAEYSGYGISFRASNTERVRIDSSGRLLVGTSSSSNGIHQDTNSTFETYKSSGHNMLRVQSDSLANGQYSMLRAHGNTSGGGSRQVFLGIYKHAGIVNPGPFMNLEAEDGADNYYWTDNSNKLRSSTNNSHIGTTSGSLVGTQTSDLRLKNVGANVSYGLAEVKQLQPKQYALKDDPDVNKLGFIAQEVESIIPEAVFDTLEELDGHQEGDRTKLGMEYVQLIPVLVNAIKELSAEVDTLKTKVAALEAA